MKVHLINPEGTKNISQLWTKITWSGDVQQVARKLEIDLVVSPNDELIPKVNIGLANIIKLFTDEGKEIFRGFVFYKEKSHQSSEMKITAYDGLIYLTKSKASYNFKNITAENITKKVCNDLGIIPGNIAITNIPLSFPSLQSSGYDTIMKAYTKASMQNSKKYIPKMNEGKLDVIEKGAYIVPKILDSKVDLTDSTYSEDIENMINQIIVTDDNGSILKVVKDDSVIKNYGLIQDVYQKEDDKNPDTVAKGMLHGIDRNAYIEALGNIECIAGNAVKIKEDYTKLTGLFYIDSDSHTWENGQHFMNLNLNFQNIMDTKEE